MHQSGTLALAAAIALAAAYPARAQQLYTGFDIDRFAPTNGRAAETAFLNDLVAYGTETFLGDAFADPQPLGFGAFGAGQVAGAWYNDINDEYALEGMSGYRAAFSGLDHPDPLVLTFGGMAVQGLGFFATSLNDLGTPGAATLRLDFFHGADKVYSWLVHNPNVGSDNTMYVALRGLSFDRVELRGLDWLIPNGPHVSDAGWFNDVTIGSSRAVLATPEPATPLLLGAGVAAIGGAAFRRRRA